MSPSHDFLDIGDVLNFELLRGIVTAVNESDDTCTVTVDGKSVTALLFYHCESGSVMRESGAITGAAKGFTIGDEVIVLKKYDDSVLKVIGHTNGIRDCSEESNGDYYIFYRDGGDLKIANCTYADEIVINETRTKEQIFLSYNTPATPAWSDKIIWFCKKFTYNGKYLYFIASNLMINLDPFAGWTAFAAANPSHPLVVNTANTQITWTSELLAKLNAVNKQVNTEHPYVPEYGLNDNWKILTGTQAGDCEDLALTKAQALLNLGYPASAIHIEVGFSKTDMREDGHPKGHAWLVVQTTLADYALDLGRDDAIVNSALRWPSIQAEGFIGRRRQIGRNWAFISSFGFLESSVLTVPYGLNAGVAYYILDPELNIFHNLLGGTTYWPDWDYGSSFAPAIPFVGVEQSYGRYPDYYSNYAVVFSVNFSSDKIYFCRSFSNIYSPELEQKTYITEYTFSGSGCVEGTTTTYTGTQENQGNIGFVNNSGGLVEIPHSDTDRITPVVTSVDGHFDISIVNHGSIAPNCTLNIMISKTSTPALKQVLTSYSPDAGYYQLPDGQHVSFGPGNGHVINCWTQVDAGSLLLQGALFNDFGEVTICQYKDGLSCLSALKTAVGVSSDNDFLGIAYVPGTDRLNN